MRAGLLGLFKMATSNPNKFVPGNWIKAAKTQINSSSRPPPNYNQRCQRHYSRQNCESFGNYNNDRRRYFNHWQQQSANEFTNTFRRRYSNSADFTHRRKPQVMFRNLRSRAYNQDEDKYKNRQEFDLPSTSNALPGPPVANYSQSWHDIHSSRRTRSYQRGSERLVRDWLTTDERGNYLELPMVPKCGVNDFNIMSYNILSQIVCLQEVEDFHFSRHIAPWLESRGYEFSYKKRIGADRDKPDGVLTAWKRGKFKVMTSRPVEYFRNSHKLTRCHNVALISVLAMANGRHVCVGNTHLLYNPKRGDIKLVQLATLFAEIDKVMTSHTRRVGERPPLVMCGDFNSTPGSPLYKFVTEGSLFYKDIGVRSISGQGEDKKGPGPRIGPNLIPGCLGINKNSTFVEERGQTAGSKYIISHHLGALRSSGHEHREFETTTMQNEGVTVDFIFYSPSQYISEHNLPCEGPALELKGRLSKTLAGEINKVNGIPNHVHSSDHLPVISQFKFI